MAYDRTIPQPLAEPALPQLSYPATPLRLRGGPATDTLERALDRAHVLHHLEPYRHADPAALVRRMATPHVIDPRGTLDADAWTRAGWVFTALGTKPSVSAVVWRGFRAARTHGTAGAGFLLVTRRQSVAREEAPHVRLPPAYAARPGEPM